MTKVCELVHHARREAAHVPRRLARSAVQDSTQLAKCGQRDEGRMTPRPRAAGKRVRHLIDRTRSTLLMDDCTGCGPTDVEQMGDVDSSTR